MREGEGRGGEGRGGQGRGGQGRGGEERGGEGRGGEGRGGEGRGGERRGGEGREKGNHKLITATLAVTAQGEVHVRQSPLPLPSDTPPAHLGQAPFLPFQHSQSLVQCTSPMHHLPSLDIPACERKMGERVG